MGQTEKRILVVDDDDAIRALLLTVLRRRGFKVDTARNGVEALERSARCRYSLVLLDLMMPRMSGYQLLEQVESWPASQRPCIIVLTAGNEPRNINPDLVAGTVSKPFDIELLIDMIAAYILAATETDQTDSCPAAESEHPPLQNGSAKPN